MHEGNPYLEHKASALKQSTINYSENFNLASCKCTKKWKGTTMYI